MPIVDELRDLIEAAPTVDILQGVGDECNHADVFPLLEVLYNQRLKELGLKELRDRTRELCPKSIENRCPLGINVEIVQVVEGRIELIITTCRKPCADFLNKSFQCPGALLVEQRNLFGEYNLAKFVAGITDVPEVKFFDDES